MRKILFAIGLWCGLIGFGTPAFAQACRISAPKPTEQCGARISATYGASVAIHANVAGSKGCRSVCLNNMYCHAWTYVFAEKKCYLHQQVDPVVNNDCCATGKR